MKKKRRLLSPILPSPCHLSVVIAAVNRHIEILVQIWPFDASLLTPLLAP